MNRVRKRIPLKIQLLMLALRCAWLRNWALSKLLNNESAKMAEHVFRNETAQEVVGKLVVALEERLRLADPNIVVTTRMAQVAWTEGKKTTMHLVYRLQIIDSMIPGQYYEAFVSVNRPDEVWVPIASWGTGVWILGEAEFPIFSYNAKDSYIFNVANFYNFVISEAWWISTPRSSTVLEVRKP